MRSITIPAWVKRHLVLNGNYWNIEEKKKEVVRTGIRKFVSEKGVLATIVIPAWNEEESILSTLSSLSEQILPFKCELLIVNNNSTDKTQEVLDDLGVNSVMEKRQGVGYARQTGLEIAKGKYFLCADADCIYPKYWVRDMVNAMDKNKHLNAEGVYSDYSFITSGNPPRIVMAVYEIVRNIIYYFKLRKKVHLLVRGFSFGFLKERGLENGAFLMGKQRVGKGILGSEDYAIGGEDGNMAYTIINNGGKVLAAKGPGSVVWTSDRRIVYDGGFLKALKIRLKKYFFKKKP